MFLTQNHRQWSWPWPLFPATSQPHSAAYTPFLPLFLAHIPPLTRNAFSQQLYLLQPWLFFRCHLLESLFSICHVELIFPWSLGRLFAPLIQHLSHPAFYLGMRDTNKLCEDRNHVLFIAHSPENTIFPTNTCHFEGCTKVFRHPLPPWYTLGLEKRE